MRERYREGAGFEEVAGYSRAARHAGDTYGQTRASLERALAAVERLGGRREDVIRTRVYLAPRAEWREAVRAHKEMLGGVDPANTTFFVAGFVAEEMLVEVELDAELAG